MPLTLIRFFVNNRAWLADMTRPVNLARPLVLDGSGPSWFGAPSPKETPLEMPGFPGRVSDGGSVNVSRLEFAPHCTGTHTESSAHLTTRANPVSRLVTPGLLPASLVTMHDGTAGAMTAGLDGVEKGFLEALVVRQPTPFAFDPDALTLAVRHGVQHLVVEASSVDPEDDGGRLAAHRAFWQLTSGPIEGTSVRTITELARVPAGLTDGPYLLDLQIPDMVTDAVPSRPVLYP
ncbi:MAG: hypothetical protein HKN29_10310, partial [Rhodothermales bacterium]|nr:hypothetical protein [Rhodothermales bacterium]